MRIGIDAVSVLPDRTGGIETYTVELIRELARASRHELVVFAQPGLRERIEADVEFVDVPSASGSQRAAFLTQLSWLPVAAESARVELLHHVKNYACSRTSAVHVLTLHDICPEYFLRTEPLSAGGRNAVRTILMSSSARLVDHVITVSEAAAAEIRRVTGVAAERISVTTIAPKRLKSAVEVDCRSLVGEPGYFLAIGKAAPYKNLVRLARAHSAARSRRRLVICGVSYAAEDAANAELVALAKTSAGRIHLAGFVPEEALASVYSSARAVICPSLVEGFGLIPVEASSFGVPVAASDIPTHRETMADAALFFSPFDESAIAAAIDRLDEDDALCRALASAGKQRAGPYSWAATATQTLDVYDKVMRRAQVRRRAA
jgi:glycosyltransferase involved in cell wall biosynthesis